MKAGGIGGAKTVTGLRFEKEVNLLTKIANVPGYTVKDNIIYFKDRPLAYSYPKKKLFSVFLKDKGIDYRDYVSKGYEPDEALYVPSQNTVYIIEMNLQSGAGSVDEKLQTCDFKKKIYTKALSALNLKVEYIFLLSDFFDNPRYRDSFNYIQESGCSYHLGVLPFSELKFPMPVTDSEKIDSGELETEKTEVIS